MSDSIPAQPLSARRGVVLVDLPAVDGAEADESDTAPFPDDDAPAPFPDDTRFGSYSPGLAMHLGLAEGAAAAAIQHIDMGPGAKGYKQWFWNRDLVVA
jgi:hypothetical protein